MSKSAFSIYDKETGVYDTPQFQENRIAIMRGMMVFLSQNPESALARFPESFALYYVGEFDALKGSITTPVNPQFVEEIRNLMPKPKIAPIPVDMESKGTT